MLYEKYAIILTYWGERASMLPTREIVDVLVVTGGVPRYLEEVNPRLSADENIKCLCFHLQTRRSVHIVEVRHRQEIGEEVEADVRAKCSKLKLPDNVAMRTGLVYDGKLDPVVRGNAYFDVILSSREILGLQ